MDPMAKRSGANVVDDAAEVGTRLRRARVEHGLSLREVARRLDISASALSQIETGKSRASVRTLYALTTELGLSLDQLFAEPGEDGAPTAQSAETESDDPEAMPVVQPVESRPAISLDGGVIWERLTAGHDPNVDFVEATYEPHSSSSGGDRLVRHRGREYGVVTSGSLELTVGFETYELGPGDACSFDSGEPHRLANPGDQPATAFWFVVGRRDSDTRATEFED
jgi:transcriptional regulator with XRE-family HTH domain